MKKTLLLFVLLVISTTSYAKEKEYYYWGDLDDGGIKSIVPYPKTGWKSQKYKVNPSSYGKYLGFSVFIKTTNINDKVRPYIFLQNKYEKRIKTTQWGQNIEGTKSWKRYYTPHIYVPSNAEWVYVGVHIDGAGKVEFSDDKIKEYSYK